MTDENNQSRSDILRSLEIIDFAEHAGKDIHIIGMGAVGARVFEQLVCLGARSIHCYDFDTVEQHNLQNQLWEMSDIGELKIDAAANWLERKTGTSKEDCAIQYHNVRVDQKLVAETMSGLIVLCLDSFDGRRDVMNGAVESGKVSFLIEGRCAPSFNEVRIINPFDESQVEGFLSSLGSDEGADPYLSICGLPINFSPIMTQCALMMVTELVNFLKEGYPPMATRKIRTMSEPATIVGRMPV